MRIRGTVKWFNETKGYGFLRRDDGQSDCFVHHSDIQSEGFRTLREGEKVEFDVIQQPKGPKASNVVKLGDADSSPVAEAASEVSAAPSEPATAPEPTVVSEPEPAAPAEPADSGFGSGYETPSESPSGNSGEEEE